MLHELFIMHCKLAYDLLDLLSTALVVCVQEKHFSTVIHCVLPLPVFVLVIVHFFLVFLFQFIIMWRTWKM